MYITALVRQSNASVRTLQGDQSLDRQDQVRVHYVNTIAGATCLKSQGHLTSGTSELAILR